MLKDAIRTDAYRDFIYTNKDLVKDKVVLDIGCGTGILSMFAARSGAGRVYAVDNSAILDKARENVFTNKLDKVISCIKGKVEEVTLPELGNKKVDFIVSEWMGYTLLYEAMLSSVIVARDKYLAPDGIMAPSHCTIMLAPICDEDLVLDTSAFWNDVYGFDMSAMKEKIFEEMLIRHMPLSSLAGEAQRVRTLDLYSIKDAELGFTESFALPLNENVDSLDAFVLYFDTFFLASRTAELSKTARADQWPKDTKDVAFSTGPGPREKETHWRQGVCLIDPGKKGNKIEKHQTRVLTGTIAYKMSEERKREVDIEISWSLNGQDRHQKWALK